MAYEVLTWTPPDSDGEVAEFQRRDAALLRFRYEIERAIDRREGSVQLRQVNGRTVLRMAEFEVVAL